MLGIPVNDLELLLKERKIVMDSYTEIIIRQQQEINELRDVNRGLREVIAIASKPGLN